MSTTDNVEIVASFPLPPKQFYENLSESEILQLEPPQIPTDSLSIFGVEQKLTIEDKENIVITDDLISELKDKKNQIFDKFKSLFKEIKLVQDSSKLSDTLKSIDDTFQSIFDITTKLSAINAAVSLENMIKNDFEQIENFIKENK